MGAVEERMTDDERFSLLISVAGSSTVATSHDKRFPDDVTMCTSYSPGVPRLGIPALLMSDSSMGIVNLDFRQGDTATALPASIVLASSFDPDLARTGGQMIAREARSRGFNVQLAGGVNLARDPRNGPGSLPRFLPGAALVAPRRALGQDVAPINPAADESDAGIVSA
jgi:beta-glucosidase